MAKVQEKYVDISTVKNQKTIPFDQLYIEYRGSFIPLKNLDVDKTKGKGKTRSFRKVKSLDDFENFSNPNPYIYYGGTRIIMTPMKVYYPSLTVPTIFESSSYNKTKASPSDMVDYGIRRALEVGEERSGNGEYLYVQIGDEWTFMPKSQIACIDIDGREITYEQAVAKGLDLTKVELYDKYNRTKTIDTVYTEYEYNFVSIIAKDTANYTPTENSEKVPGFSRKTYSIDSNGNVSYTTQPLNQIVSDISYVKHEEDDPRPGHEGKTWTVNKVKTTNYHVIAGGNVDNPNNSIAVSVNGHIQMVKRENLADEKGNAITNLDSMVGRALTIKDGDIIVATSDPLTYDQAHLAYGTVRTYQPVLGSVPTETSCLRLADGTHVNELNTVQPNSYMIGDKSDFEKYLAFDLAANKYVIVSKDKLREIKYDPNRLFYLRRCDFNSDQCVVVQTTSKCAGVEQCSVVGTKKCTTTTGSDVSLGSEQFEEKDKVLEDFTKAYKEGDYQINGVYIDGKFSELEHAPTASGSAPDMYTRRYEYTDVSYTDDVVENDFVYRHENLQIKDGKMVGGTNFKVGAFMSSAATVWAGAFAASAVVLPVVGLFLPVVGPVLSAIQIATLAAGPAIPVVGLGAAGMNWLTKNVFMSKKIKAQRIQDEKTIKSELSDLFGKISTLTPDQFENAYGQIMDTVDRFAATTNNQSLVVVNGQAQVTSSNAHLVGKYKAERNKVYAELERCKKKLKEAEEKRKNATTVSQQKKWDAEIQKYTDLVTDLTTRLGDLDNTVIGSSEQNPDPKLVEMQNRAASLRLWYHIHNKTTKILGKIPSTIDLTKLSYDAKHGLTYCGVSLFETNDKKIQKANGISLADWKIARDELLELAQDIKEPELTEPKNGDVKEKTDAIKEADNVYADCVSKLQEITEILKEINDYALIATLSTIDEAIVQSFYEEVKKQSSLADITTKLGDLKLKQDEVVAKLTAVKTIQDFNKSAQEQIAMFNTTLDELVKNNFIAAIKKHAKKDEFERRLSSLQGLDLNKILSDAKKETNISNLANFENMLKTARENVELLAEEVKDELVNQDINLIRFEIEKCLQKSKANLARLSGDATISATVPTLIEKVKGCVDVISQMLAGSKKVDNAEDAIGFKDKAELVAKLVDNVVSTIEQLQKLKASNESEVLTEISNLYMAQIEEYLNVDINLSAEELQAKLNEAENKRAEILMAITDLETKLEKALEKDPELLEELKEKDATIEELTDHLEKLLVMHDELEIERAKHVEELTESEETIARLRDENSKLLGLNDDLQEYQIKYNETVLKLQEAEEAKRKIEEQLKAERESYIRTIETLKESEEQQKLQIKNLTEEIQLLKENISKLTDQNAELSEHNTELTGKNKELEEAAVKAQEEITSLTGELKESKLIAEGIMQTLQATLEEKKKIEQQLADTTKLKDEEIKNLKDQLAGYNKQIKSLTTQLQEHVKKIEQLKTSIEQLKALNKELTEKNKELEEGARRAQTEIERLRVENEEMNRRLLEMERILEQKRQTIAQLDKNIADVEILISNIRSRLEEKQKERLRLMHRINEHEDAKRINQDLAVYRKALREIDKEIDSILSTLKSYQTRAEEIQNVWDVGSTDETKDIRDANRKRVREVKGMIRTSKEQKKTVKDLHLSNVKIDPTFDAKINSENQLLSLLSQRDPLLIAYLEIHGISCDAANIGATCNRIELKHAQYKTAQLGASKLSNQNIYRILETGQQFITEVAKHGRDYVANYIKTMGQVREEGERTMAQLTEEFRLRDSIDRFQAAYAPSDYGATTQPLGIPHVERTLTPIHRTASRGTVGTRYKVKTPEKIKVEKDADGQVRLYIPGQQIEIPTGVETQVSTTAET